ncbi:MAG: Mrp/NBP35 family ATP-binding protein [Candidatus Helarchaeota archaeon]
MVNKTEVITTLKNVMFPGLNKSLADLDLVKNLEIIDDKKIKITFKTLALDYQSNEDIKAHTILYLKDKLNLDDVEVNFVKMTPQEHNEFMKKLTPEEEKKISASMIPKFGKQQLKNIIVVTSGKGGVGKSFVSSILASYLRRSGMSVGILDADITGSSIAKFFGLRERPIVIADKIIPVQSKNGIKIISMNLLLPEETNPVLWRGPLINKILQEFYERVDWGPLDILVLDLPPGTSDTHLTIYQSYPVDGIIFVSTPQDLAAMIVEKGINMAKIMNVPIFGLVENMSHLVCPYCNKEIELYGPPQGAKVAELYNLNFLGKIPLDPKISTFTDEGRIEDYSNDIIKEISDKVKEKLKL